MLNEENQFVGLKICGSFDTFDCDVRWLAIWWAMICNWDYHRLFKNN